MTESEYTREIRRGGINDWKIELYDKVKVKLHGYESLTHAFLSIYNEHSHVVVKLEREDMEFLMLALQENLEISKGGRKIAY